MVSDGVIIIFSCKVYSVFIILSLSDVIFRGSEVLC